MESQGKLCCCLVSDSILGYSILSQRYLVVSLLGYERCKGINYMKEVSKRWETKIFYILPLFLGSTTIQKLFLNTTEIV